MPGSIVSWVVARRWYLLLLGLVVGVLLAVFIIHQPYFQILLVGIPVLGFLALILTKVLTEVPKRQAFGVQGLKDHLTIENATRQTLAQILGGAVLIVGLFFTWASLKITEDTAIKNQKIARDGQIADRLTKAVALLGEQAPDKLAVRLGSIYALEQIAREREDYHWPIMEILTAYLRTTRPRLSLEPLPVAAEAPRPPKFTIDTEAVLTVLKRRNLKNEQEGACLNWRSTDLRLTNLNEEGAYLYWRSIDRKLTHPMRKGTCPNLRSVDLTLANLHEAELTRAQFASAHLRRAYFVTSICGWL
jgi:hypothetical protein